LQDTEFPKKDEFFCMAMLKNPTAPALIFIRFIGQAQGGVCVLNARCHIVL